MKCINCGNVNDENAKFCFFCGSKINAPLNEISYPVINKPINQDVSHAITNDVKQKNKKKSGKNGISKNKIIAVTSTIVAVILVIVIIILIKGSDNSKSVNSKGTAANSIEKPTEAAENGTVLTDSSSEDPDGYEAAGIVIKDEELAEYGLDEDIDAYYANNSTVISVISADESNVAYSEREAVDKMAELGLDQFEVMYSYSIDGLYYSEAKVASDSDDRRPMYETYYVDVNENVWTIYLINDRIMAYPVSYNLQSEAAVPVVLSEKESVVSYYYTANKFFETVPNETELIVVVAGNINKELLDKMTIEEIDKYVN